MTRWIDPATVHIPASIADLHLHPLVAQTLVQRGLSDPASARAFMHPEQSASVPFPGIGEAVDIIRSAIRKQEKICVWGDFDVDGQTSTALLVQALRALGAQVIYYVPVRAKESHGVHIPSLQPIIDSGARLLLTCDTGVTAYEAIDYARACGMQVVVTDHHDPGETLPHANALIDPKLLADDHPLAYLAGVGVAYKLAEALLLQEHPAELEALLDLVALGLIADVALLQGETRSLAQRGVQALRQTKRLGLQAIAHFTGTNLETLTEETIGFTFGPRLNALGRLSDANPAVDLLLTDDPVQAKVMANQIESLNSQRQLLTSQVYQAAEAQLRADPRLLTAPAIVLSHPRWPGGVVGLVAGRLAERYHKPAILLSGPPDGILRGSARSVEGLHITEAIAAQKALLHSFGGHPMAAGLALDAEKLPNFRKGLGRSIEKQLGSSIFEEPSLQIDAWLGLEELTLELAEALEVLAPFGAGNPALTLATRDVRLKSASKVTRSKEHLRLVVEDGAGRTQEIMWWGGAGEEMPEEGSRFDIAYSLRASSFRGQRQASLRFLEFRIVEGQEPLRIESERIQIVDLRTVERPATHLRELKETAPDLQVWAEGADRALGNRRHELQPAAELAIYTAPPSRALLHQALEKVAPQQVYLFAASRAGGQVDEFLHQLAGLCKYAMSHRGGKASVEELAAASAQREITVRHGLEWLCAGGHIQLRGEDDLVIEQGNAQGDPELQKQFHETLQSLLEETASFRQYYASISDPDSLINPRDASDA